MPRRLFKRYMPDPEMLKEHRSLRFLGKLLHEPNLWHLNRRSVSRAMAMGLFAAFVPLPMQMLLAASLAILCRANLPISVGLVWLTNPFTMPPIFYCTYQLGSWLLHMPPIHLPDELSISWVSAELSTHWQPFLLGSVVTGVIAAVLGYCLTNLYWHWWVRYSWHKRQKLRRQNRS
jgi:uncharacterized protein (DUF2062 family)